MLWVYSRGARVSHFRGKKKEVRAGRQEEGIVGSYRGLKKGPKKKNRDNARKWKSVKRETDCPRDRKNKYEGVTIVI